MNTHKDIEVDNMDVSDDEDGKSKSADSVSDKS